MRTSSLAFAALIAMPVIVGAQQHPGGGNGFLFHQPDYTLGFRAGYSRANAASDFYSSQQRLLTIGPRGFDALSLGVDFGINLAPRVDLSFTIDGTTRSTKSAYRDWFEGPQDLPIRQTTNLSTVGLSANIRYNLADRGRAISNFAWVPAQVVPYIGTGGGVLNYDLEQTGDFVSLADSSINSDRLTSSGWAAMGQVFSGINYSLSTRYSLVTEARYTISSARLNKDYQDGGFGPLDLSGLSLNIGTSIRF